MGNLSHTVGGTDNLVSFKSAARVPIDSLKVHFSPIQEGEGDPSPENIRPIRGWNEVEAYRSGKNIARVTGYNAMNTKNADTHNDLSNNYGTTISTNDYSLPDTSVVITQTQAPNISSMSSYRNGYFAIMVKNLIYGCYYDVSFKITNITNNLLNANLSDFQLYPNAISLVYQANEIGNGIVIFKNVLWKRYSEDPTNAHYNRSCLEIRNCGMSFTLSEFMVTPAGMNDGVFEPYCGEVIPVTFPAEVGTIYGGYVDLAKGEAVAEWVKVTKKLSDYTSKTEYEDNLTYYNFKPLCDLPCFASDARGGISHKTSICSIAPHSWSTSNNKNNHYYIFEPADSNITRMLLYLKTSEITSEDIEFELAFFLKDPIHYPLTPVQLQAFINHNSFWSNTNDVTEVSYTIHDTAQIRAARKRIMAASPHLETASNDLITFNTDVSAPLKECKVYFEPVQEGEGDPSPDNIRPIKGWNQLEVYRTNKNLIPFKKYQYLCNVNYYNGYSGWVDRIEVNSLPRNVNLTYSVYLDCTNCTDTNNDNRAAIWIMQNNGKYRKIIGNVIKNGSSGISTAKVTLYDNDTDDWVAFGLNIFKETSASDPIVEVGDEITEPVEHDSTVIPITFPSEAGTIYGGYVDLVKGKLIVDFVIEEPNEENFNFETGYAFQWGHSKCATHGPIDFRKGISSHWINTMYDNRHFVFLNYNGAFLIGKDFFDAAEIDFTKEALQNYIAEQKTKGTPLQAGGPLVTPLEYDIDPQTLKTLRGTNNIWSTSNGPITIKYWKH